MCAAKMEETKVSRYSEDPDFSRLTLKSGSSERQCRGIHLSIGAVRFVQSGMSGPDQNKVGTVGRPEFPGSCSTTSCPPPLSVCSPAEEQDQPTLQTSTPGAPLAVWPGLLPHQLPHQRHGGVLPQDHALHRPVLQHPLWSQALPHWPRPRAR